MRQVESCGDPDPLAYYARHGPITDPGEHAELLEGLPTEIPALCQIVQGILLHIFWAEQYGVKLSEERQHEVQLRHISRRLAHLQATSRLPLTIARPPAERQVGNCRDFAVTLCAMLRHQGVPARRPIPARRPSLAGLPRRSG